MSDTGQRSDADARRWRWAREHDVALLGILGWGGSPEELDADVDAEIAREAPPTVAQVVHDAGLHFGPMELYGKRVDGSEGLLSLEDQVALMGRDAVGIDEGEG